MSVTSPSFPPCPRLDHPRSIHTYIHTNRHFNYIPPFNILFLLLCLFLPQYLANSCSGRYGQETRRAGSFLNHCGGYGVAWGRESEEIIKWINKSVDMLGTDWLSRGCIYGLDGELGRLSSRMVWWMVYCHSRSVPFLDTPCEMSYLLSIQLECRCYRIYVTGTRLPVQWTYLTAVIIHALSHKRVIESLSLQSIRRSTSKFIQMRTSKRYRKQSRRRRRRRRGKRKANHSSSFFTSSSFPRNLRSTLLRATRSSNFSGADPPFARIFCSRANSFPTYSWFWLILSATLT